MRSESGFQAVTCARYSCTYSAVPYAHTYIIIRGTPFDDTEYINDHWSEAPAFKYADKELKAAAVAVEQPQATGVPVDGLQAAEGEAEGESADDSDSEDSETSSSTSSKHGSAPSPASSEHRSKDGPE